ncbi:MAG: hypothetical protein AAF310_00485 [Myxococcota bacterium]
MSFVRSLLYVAATGVCAVAVWLLFFSGPKYVGPLAADQVIDKVQQLYSNRAGFEISDKEKESIVKQSSNSTEGFDSYHTHVYGEITPQAARELLSELQLGKEDVFYDLGSGVGKLVLQAHLATPVGKSVGIELSKTRYDIANDALKQLRADGLIDPARVLQLRLQNILTAKWDDATVVYTCSTLFPDKLMQGMADKIAAIDHPVRVITLKKFPPNPRLHHIETLFVNTTWSPDVPVYVYESADKPSQPPVSAQAKLDPREIKYIINDYYVHVSSALGSRQELQEIKRAGGATSYGEVTFEGVTTMLQQLKLDKGSVFYDLGCGVGRLATQVYMMSDARKVVGIEVSETRYWQCLEVRDRLKAGGKIVADRQLEFRHEDIAKSDYGDATALYISSLFFTKKLVDRVVGKAVRMPRQVKLVTLTPLQHKRLRLLKRFVVATTWSPRVNAYMYETLR